MTDEPSTLTTVERQAERHRDEILSLLYKTPHQALNKLAWYRIKAKIESEIATEADWQRRGGDVQRAARAK